VTRSRSVPAVALGLTAVAVIAVAVPVALARHGSSASATVAVAPLTATDRRVLAATKPLVQALPTAIAEIPQAASAAAGHRVTPAEASAFIAKTPALAPLARALARPGSVTASLTAAYADVLAGRQPASSDQLAADLETLQTVQGDVGPAVRLVAAKAGRRLGAAAALSVLTTNRDLRPLGGFVGGWQQIYGAFTLVEQQAAS
jgi:hypothetical protein